MSRRGPTNGESAPQVLRVAGTNLHLMNGVNLATAIHRLARACEGSKANADQVTSDPVFQLMLEIAECKALQEFQLRDTSMPGNCCTIITWSCAVLRIFVPSLLGVLARVASRQDRECLQPSFSQAFYDLGNEVVGPCKVLGRLPVLRGHQHVATRLWNWGYYAKWHRPYLITSDQTASA